MGSILFANFNIIPTTSPVYDITWDYAVPIAIPLLLLKADIRKIKNESGRIFKAFHISAFGTVVSTFIAAFALRSTLPYVAEIAGMMTGSYIGGVVNFVAMTSAYNTPENITNSTIVADNLVMAVYFFNGAFILLFCILSVSIHLIVTLGVGKLFKFKLDELLLVSNACIGGPTTAVAMAIAKGWNSLIIPTMLSGIWGYILGNYAGIFVGNILLSIL